MRQVSVRTSTQRELDFDLLRIFRIVADREAQALARNATCPWLARSTAPRGVSLSSPQRSAFHQRVAMPGPARRRARRSRTRRSRDRDSRCSARRDDGDALRPLGLGASAKRKLAVVVDLRESREHRRRELVHPIEEAEITRLSDRLFTNARSSSASSGRIGRMTTRGAVAHRTSSTELDRVRMNRHVRVVAGRASASADRRTHARSPSCPGVAASTDRAPAPRPTAARRPARTP